VFLIGFQGHPDARFVFNDRLSNTKYVAN